MCCACSSPSNKGSSEPQPKVDTAQTDPDTTSIGLHPVVRPSLERDTPLPALARELLLDTMWNHGEAMENLLWSALMLDHDMTQVNVQQILTTPRLSRPVTEAGETLNDSLPPEFFELQDQMYAAAQQLADASRERNDVGTAAAYGDLARTCISCHSVYLHIPGD